MGEINYMYGKKSSKNFKVQYFSSIGPNSAIVHHHDKNGPLCSKVLHLGLIIRVWLIRVFSSPVLKLYEVMTSLLLDKS